ncbi:hypothetical protein V6N13_007744 [Hibiscus sabdariffa]
MLMKSHSALCFPSLPRQESRQLQRVETRQLQLIEEAKVFRTSLIHLLCFQFPDATQFFPPQTTTAPPHAASAVNPSDEVGQMEPINLSEEDIFDLQTPFEHQPEVRTDIPESSNARKRKQPAGRTIQADAPSDAADKPNDISEIPAPQSPAKRQRHYNVVSNDSDDADSTNPTSSRSLAF